MSELEDAAEAAYQRLARLRRLRGKGSPEVAVARYEYEHAADRLSDATILAWTAPKK